MNRAASTHQHQYAAGRRDLHNAVHRALAAAHKLGQETHPSDAQSLQTIARDLVALLTVDGWLRSPVERVQHLELRDGRRWLYTGREYSREVQFRGQVDPLTAARKVIPHAVLNTTRGAAQARAELRMVAAKTR